MPALPWTTISSPDRARDYVVMASRLPLARYRDLPGFPAHHDAHPGPGDRTGGA